MEHILEKGTKYFLEEIAVLHEQLVLLEELEVLLEVLEVLLEELKGLGAQLVPLEVLGCLRWSTRISHICFTPSASTLASCALNKVMDIKRM